MLYGRLRGGLSQLILRREVNRDTCRGDPSSGLRKEWRLGLKESLVLLWSRGLWHFVARLSAYTSAKFS